MAYLNPSALKACNEGLIFVDSRRAAHSPSLRDPAAVDLMRGAGDLRGVIGTKENRERPDLFDRDELFCWLRFENDFLNDFFFGHAARFRRIRDLLFNQRRFHIAGADSITGNAVLCAFKGDGFGKTDNAVVGFRPTIPEAKMRQTAPLLTIAPVKPASDGPRAGYR